MLHVQNLDAQLQLHTVWYGYMSMSQKTPMVVLSRRSKLEIMLCLDAYKKANYVCCEKQHCFGHEKHSNLAKLWERKKEEDWHFYFNPPTGIFTLTQLFVQNHESQCCRSKTLKAENDGCSGCTNPQIFGPSPFAPADFEAFSTMCTRWFWDPELSFIQGPS